MNYVAKVSGLALVIVAALKFLAVLVLPMLGPLIAVLLVVFIGSLLLHSVV